MNCYGTELVLCVYVKRRVKVSPRPWLLKRHRRLLETSSASWPSCTTISCSSRPRPRLPKLAPGASAETPVRRLWTWWWALDFIQVFMVLDFLSVSSSFLKKTNKHFFIHTSDYVRPSRVQRGHRTLREEEWGSTIHHHPCGHPAHAAVHCGVCVLL